MFEANVQKQLMVTCHELAIVWSSKLHFCPSSAFALACALLSCTPGVQAMQIPIRISAKGGKKHRERPHSLVLLTEMAFIVPLFLAVYWGTMEAGNMLLTWMTLQSAAQQGALAGVHHAGGTDSERVARIMGVVSDRSAWLKAGTSVVLMSGEPEPGAEESLQEYGPGRLGDKIMVRVETAYKPLVPLFAGMLPGIALSGKAVAGIATLEQSVPAARGQDDEARQEDSWLAVHLY